MSAEKHDEQVADNKEETDKTDADNNGAEEVAEETGAEMVVCLKAIQIEDKSTGSDESISRTTFLNATKPSLLVSMVMFITLVSCAYDIVPSRG